MSGPVACTGRVAATDCHSRLTGSSRSPSPSPPTVIWPGSATLPPSSLPQTPRPPPWSLSQCTGNNHQTKLTQNPLNLLEVFKVWPSSGRFPAGNVKCKCSLPGRSRTPAPCQPCSRATATRTVSAASAVSASRYTGQTGQSGLRTGRESSAPSCRASGSPSESLPFLFHRVKISNPISQRKLTDFHIPNFLRIKWLLKLL